MNGVAAETVLARETAATYAEWFRALADPTRVQLLAWLAQQPGSVSVGQLTAVLPVGQSTVSHHLTAFGGGGLRSRAATGHQFAVRRQPPLPGVLAQRGGRRDGQALT